MNQHLLLWTCGPVQDFIASARKGRDLWFGSWILSEIATAAALTILDSGGELILPAPTSREELVRADYDVPNRVLARVSGDNPAALAEEVSIAAKRRLMSLAHDLFARLEDRAAGCFDRDRADEQVYDLIETAWAITRTTGDDRRDRRRVEALLAARKSLRPFRAPTFAAWGVPKSSLDGQREAVTREDAGQRLGLGATERLCGVGLLKRLGHEVADPSAPGGRVATVSVFALHTWLRPAIEANQPAVEEAIERLHRGLEAALPEAELTGPRQPIFGTLEPHALYPNRLRDLMEAIPAGGEQLHKDALHAFRQEIEGATGVALPTTPNPYYAVLVGDGDRLGQLLDGLTHAQVQGVSRALATFAKTVRTEVFAQGELRGDCIYAGGDDVLAFVPVDVALSQARRLSEVFARAFEGVDGVNDPPTFSVGICVAHHLAPLRDVLDGARAAEGLAKQGGGMGDEGRDSWALKLLKRSGGPLDVRGPWSRKGDLEVSALAAQSRPGGALPRGLARDVHVAAQRFGEGREAPEVQRCELQRILSQKAERTGDAAPHAALAAQLEGRTLAQLADRLIVARALSGFGGAT